MKFLKTIGLLFVAATIIISCKKNTGDAGQANIPVLTTSAVINVNQYTVKCGGNISSDGGATINFRGVCWSTNSKPTIADNKTVDGSGTGIFISSITGLTNGTTYYARAYATNNNGTGYGEVDTFNTLVVGQVWQGGVLAYLFKAGDPGYIAGAAHGLVTTPNNISSGVAWSNTGAAFVATGATGKALGTGNANTNLIVSILGATSNAARTCSDLTLNTFSDWYLPSKDELNILYLNRVAIGNFPLGQSYWSSTENGITTAWTQNFINGNQYDYDKGANFYCRPVRTF